jgi:hypothetical protein
MGGGSGIYSPNHQTSRLVKAAVAWRTGQSGAPTTSPNHWILTVGASVFWATRQALFSVWCAIWLCSDSGVHCSAFIAFCRRPLARSSRCSTGTPDSPMPHRTLSGATPDSPVNYSGAASRNPEGEQFGVGVPGAPDTVRCARPGHTSADFCSLNLNPFSVFLLVCCEPLAPVELII